MAGDDGRRPQCLDHLEPCQPRVDAPGNRLHEVQVDIGVHGVTGDHEADRRDVQCGGAVGIGVAEVDRHQVLAFEWERVTIERLGDEEPIRQLPGEPGPPEAIQPRWAELLLHPLDHRGRRHHLRVGKTVEHRRGAEEVVAVAVGDEDRWSGSCRWPRSSRPGPRPRPPSSADRPGPRRARRKSASPRWATTSAGAHPAEGRPTRRAWTGRRTSSSSASSAPVLSGWTDCHTDSFRLPRIWQKAATSWVRHTQEVQRDASRANASALGLPGSAVPTSNC